MSIFKRRDKGSNAPIAATPPQSARVLPQSLLWLGDSPMFIDTVQVQSFYDAVIRPEYEQDSLVLSNSVTTGTQISGGLNVGSAFPWVKAEAQVSGQRTRQRQKGDQVTLKPVHNAQRQLEHLSLYYVDRYLTGDYPRVRMVTCNKGDDGQPTFDVEPEGLAWDDPDLIRRSPRVLLFIDLPVGTRFVPTALETVKGKVLTLYDKLAEAIAPEGEKPPTYPGSSPDKQNERDEYWAWFDKNFNDTKAMEVVEKTVETDRIEWIDYRVSMGSGKHFLHLHVCGRGKNDTGTFAYQFIKRGSKHGLRLVGTLKSEPDMNVLAIFEK
jgi:hypothetical protein